MKGMQILKSSFINKWNKKWKIQQKWRRFHSTSFDLVTHTWAHINDTYLGED